MKINLIRYSHNDINKTAKNVNHKNCLYKQNKIEKLPLPSTDYMLAFTGGKSLNLEQTIKQIEQFGSFPPDIKEEAKKIIKENNPDNKTLIDIHREKYDELNYLDNLDEIKEFYPEFEGVLSDNEIEYQAGSFIDDVKQGKIQYFDKNQDVAVQLLQMYWGNGFSLNDLKNQFAGRNINSILEKLNIPKTNRIYGHYLKLSDKEYNERFASIMSERLKGQHREKVIRNEGVYIPKGPLTPEHKANISKGLTNHFAEHPEKALEMSERQKKFYEEHPEEKIKFSQVMLRAWGEREAKSIRKTLSKFMKRSLTDEELSNVFAQDKETKEKLKAFWNRNQWAKDKFSICMKKSWKRQKELTDMGLIYEPFCFARLIPTKMQKKIGRIVAPNDDNFANVVTSLIPDIKEMIDNPNLVVPAGSTEMKRVGKLIDDYLEANPEEQNTLADTLDLAFVIALKEMAKIKAEDSDKLPALDEITTKWQNGIYKNWKQHKFTSINELVDTYSSFMNICMLHEDKASAKKIDECIEIAYDLMSHDDKEKRDIITRKILISLAQMGIVDKNLLSSQFVFLA